MLRPPTAVNLSWTLHLGAALYALNLALGLAAWVLRARFGVLHHWLYALVFAAALAAAVFAFHPALLLTLAALTAMPSTKPRSKAHPAVALLGACGYVIVYSISLLQPR